MIKSCWSLPIYINRYLYIFIYMFIYIYYICISSNVWLLVSYSIKRMQGTKLTRFHKFYYGILIEFLFDWINRVFKSKVQSTYNSYIRQFSVIDHDFQHRIWFYFKFNATTYDNKNIVVILNQECLYFRGVLKKNCEACRKHQNCFPKLNAMYIGFYIFS